MKQTNLFPKFAEFINEASSLPNFTVTPYAYSGTASSEYYFTLTNMPDDREIDITLYAIKGKTYMDNAEDYEAKLNPKLTYLVLDMSVDGYFIFDIRQWYKVNDLFLSCIKGTAKDGASVELKVTDQTDKKVTEIKFTLVPEDEWDEDGENGDYFIEWRVDDHIHMYLSKKQVQDLTKIKYNK